MMLFLFQLGCVLCLLGSTTIVIHSPMTQTIDTYTTITTRLLSTQFLVYLSINLLLIATLMAHFVPKNGKKNLIWLIMTCSLVGGLMVISCKSLGMMIKSHFEDPDEYFNWWVPVALVASVCLGVCLQMAYLNRALDLFNTSIVTPIYYVCFTTCVLIGSTVLFNEFGLLKPSDVIGSLTGFATIIVGVFLLNAFRNLDINLDNIKIINREKNLAIAVDIAAISKTYNQKTDNTRL